ncbi:hypothetical protein [Motiliproteus sp. SC1-56]|uniref:hypothetical protein n=1 Tax=Motiliproteus sp. SC1-56 TaxID=2799565 RepID=UPI001A8D262B|nr:hypothetical protein [Motiliproteus sp. SC1-56]
MDPTVVFGLAGAFSMSAAIAASKLLKLPAEEQPAWARGTRGNKRVLIAGNLCALVLVAAMVFGVTHLAWWIPVLCLFITFPVVHVIILEPLLGLARALIVGALGALMGAVLIGLFW